LPVSHPIRNYALLGKLDFSLNSSHQLGISYNFDYSKNTNQTFDVATYGNSANGIEGPSKNQQSQHQPFLKHLRQQTERSNIFHIRGELRPAPARSLQTVPADTGVGLRAKLPVLVIHFSCNQRSMSCCGAPHVKDNFSIISGNHTVKLGGEWIHTLNDQVFRGFLYRSL